MSAPATTFAPLKEKLDAAVTGDDVDEIARRVKQALQETLKANGLSLPEAFRTPLGHTYARRLLHRIPRAAIPRWS